MEGGTGLHVLVAISVVLALAAHAATRRYLLASIGVGVVAAVVFQAVDDVPGDLDLAIAAVSFAYASVIALAIGIPFAIVRVARKGGHGPSSHYDPQ
jgi:hypothetical protein